MLSKIPACAALILDMDGLLLDSENTYLSAWRYAAESLGYCMDEAFWASLTGLHYQAVEEKFGTNCGEMDFECFRQRSSRYWRKHVEQYGIALKNGFHDLFAAIDATALPYCLATNSRNADAEECLRLAGVAEMFPLRLTRDHVTEGKPAPEIIFKAAARLDTAIERCWVIEDSYTGIAAAKSAGAIAVCIPQAQPAELRLRQAADLLLPDLTALSEVIRAQFATTKHHHV
ncbi:MAG: HAD family hydrolase [Gammaproteobacteria bacterium]